MSSYELLGVGGGKGGRRPRCPFILLYFFLLTFLSHLTAGIATTISNTTFIPAAPLRVRMEESKEVVVQLAYYRHKIPRRAFSLSIQSKTEDPHLFEISYKSTIIDFSTDDQGDDGDAAATAVGMGGGKNAIGKNDIGYFNATFTLHGIFLGNSDVELSFYLVSRNATTYNGKDPEKIIVTPNDDQIPEGEDVDLDLDPDSALMIGPLGVASAGQVEGPFQIDEDQQKPLHLETEPKVDDRRVETETELEVVTTETLADKLRYKVGVLRGAHTKMLNAIFVSTLGCLIILANVMMGAELNLETVKEVLRRPVAPIIGFFCQFALMPSISYALARALMLPAGLYSLGLGLFTSGCVPGGGASNFWTVLLRGNADLSITMTTISTLAAFAMMPLWMWALGSHFLPPGMNEGIQIPYKNILVSLSCLGPPLIVGVLIKRFLPKFAEMIRKVLRPFLIFIIVFILTFGTYANFYMFKLMSWRVLLGGLLLPWIGFGLGCFAAIAAKQPPANVAAIAIETGIQNSGIAIMLLKISFPEPDGDIASVVPVVVSIFTPGPLLMGYSVHLLMRWYKKLHEKPSVDDPEESKELRTLVHDKLCGEGCEKRECNGCVEKLLTEKEKEQNVGLLDYLNNDCSVDGKLAAA